MINVEKRIKKILLLFLVILTVLALISPLFCVNVYAAENYELDYPDIYKEIALNFFKEQYINQDISYDKVSVELEVDLYDSDENVVAKSIVVKRDDEYDYVVLNLATCGIDEFGFNSSSAFEKYSNKIYYTGVLDYFTKENDKFRSCETDEIYTKTDFKNISKNITDKYNKFKNTTNRTLKSGDNPLPALTGYNGFYSYSKISSFMSNNGYEFYDAKFLTGILSGDMAEGLSFKDQNVFNNEFMTGNSCGPTALTNLMIYMNWLGLVNKNGEVNALRLNSESATFDRFRQLTNHNADSGISDNIIPSALKNYASEQNYNYYIKTVSTFENFKSNLDSEYPIVTCLHLNSTEDGEFGHTVLSLGYLQFRNEYQVEHQFLWHKWTTTEYKYSNYLKVIDGWYTSNDTRYIDFSGYWDSLSGTAFRFVT
ncbi:MAG: hypothetical protein NC131_01390 [Roseburia sp.]|nr:hypothetical protein [Roseburia sp.]